MSAVLLWRTGMLAAQENHLFRVASARVVLEIVESLDALAIHALLIMQGCHDDQIAFVGFVAVGKSPPALTRQGFGLPGIRCQQLTELIHQRLLVENELAGVSTCVLPWDRGSRTRWAGISTWDRLSQARRGRWNGNRLVCDRGFAGLRGFLLAVLPIEQQAASQHAEKDCNVERAPHEGQPTSTTCPFSKAVLLCVVKAPGCTCPHQGSGWARSRPAEKVRPARSPHRSRDRRSVVGA